MLDIVTFKWRGPKGYRSTFTAESVNVLRAMVARHYQRPHRFTCVTDDPAGIDSRVRIVPLWGDHAEVPSPHGIGRPSCYRRLRLFARDAAELIGPRLVTMDLDAVITADMAPVWDRPEDIVLWAGTAGKNPYNGSMILLRAGARPQVWEQFDAVASPLLARSQGYLGSDQAWLATCLGANEARWTEADGVYSWRMKLRFNRGRLPSGARCVFFHGNADPWQDWTQSQAPWIRTHWHALEPDECLPERSIPV